MGSDVAFASQHPFVDYANKVLSDLGLNAKGFINPDSATRAYQQGFLTQKQFRDVLLQQWPRQFTSKGATQ